MLTDLNDLFFFASVVDHQGFAPAGRALGIPKSKLSRRVALLEERLGVRLIQRSTRRFSVTELGQTYYAHCKAMLVEAEAAQQAIEQTRAEPCGTVRMSCPVAILHTRVGSMVAAFMADYPKVTVHLEATNRRVDVVGEGLDLAIRVRPPPLEDSDLVLKILAQRTWCVAASPALVRTLGPAQTPEDLRKYPTLDLGPAHAQHQWRLTGRGGAVPRLAGCGQQPQPAALHVLPPVGENAGQRLGGTRSPRGGRVSRRDQPSSKYRRDARLRAQHDAQQRGL